MSRSEGLMPLKLFLLYQVLPRASGVFDNQKNENNEVVYITSKGIQKCLHS